MKTKFLLGLMFLSIIFTFAGCSGSDNVRLYDYRSITVPQEEYAVSEADLSFAVKMKLLEKDVTVQKTENPDTVEDTDVAEITLCENGDTEKKVKITVGDGEISEEFDSYIIGMKTGESKSFTLDGTVYEIRVDGILRYAEEITEDIAEKEFGCSAADAVDMIRKEIEDHRKFEYAYQELIYGTMINNFDDSRDRYIKDRLSYIYTLAQNEGAARTDYFESIFGATEEEYVGYLNNFYDEYIILKDVCDRENKTITEEEVSEYVDSFIQESGMSREEYDGLYGDEYAYCTLYYDAVYDIILEYV